VEWFRFGKGELRQRALESAATDQARQRFEAREARLFRKQQERTEKMARRKQLLQEKARMKKAASDDAGGEGDA
jgi:electron transport complex protein RnfC